MLSRVRQVFDEQLRSTQCSVSLATRAIQFADGDEIQIVAAQRDSVHELARGNDFLYVGAPVVIGVAQHYEGAGFALRNVDRAVTGHFDHARIIHFGELADAKTSGQSQRTDARGCRLELLHLNNVADFAVFSELDAGLLRVCGDSRKRGGSE